MRHSLTKVHRFCHSRQSADPETPKMADRTSDRKSDADSESGSPISYSSFRLTIRLSRLVSEMFACDTQTDGQPDNMDHYYSCGGPANNPRWPPSAILYFWNERVWITPHLRESLYCLKSVQNLVKLASSWAEITSQNEMWTGANWRQNHTFCSSYDMCHLSAKRIIPAELQWFNQFTMAINHAVQGYTSL